MFCCWISSSAIKGYLQHWVILVLFDCCLMVTQWISLHSFLGAVTRTVAIPHSLNPIGCGTGDFHSLRVNATPPTPARAASSDAPCCQRWFFHLHAWWRRRCAPIYRHLLPVRGRILSSPPASLSVTLAGSCWRASYSYPLSRHSWAHISTVFSQFLCLPISVSGLWDHIFFLVGSLSGFSIYYISFSFPTIYISFSLFIIRSLSIWPIIFTLTQ